jgi:putative spermidine/putrescine transport system permease protein
MDHSPLDRIGRTAALFLILVGVIVMIAPIAITVLLSFGETFGFPPTGLTIRWYGNFLGDRDFRESLVVSLVLAVFTVIVSTVIGTGVALALTRQSFRGRGAINSIFLSPVAMPRVAIGVSLFLFLLTIGFRTAPPRLAIVHVLMACPYVIAVVAASLQGVDPRLEQAAMNLGASNWETFRRVTLPLIRPGIVTGAIFAVIVSFDEVTASVFLIDVQTKTFPVVLFSSLARGTTDPTIAAASSFMLLFVMAIVAVLARYVGLARALGVLRQP